MLEWSAEWIFFKFNDIKNFVKGGVIYGSQVVDLKENSRKRNSLEVNETDNCKDVLHPEYPRIFNPNRVILNPDLPFWSG